MRLGCEGGRLCRSWPVNMFEETSAEVSLWVSPFQGLEELSENPDGARNPFISLEFLCHFRFEFALELKMQQQYWHTWQDRSTSLSKFALILLPESAKCLLTVLETVFMAFILGFPWSLMIFVPQVMFAQLMGAYPNVHLENLCCTSPGLRSLAGG